MINKEKKEMEFESVDVIQQLRNIMNSMDIKQSVLAEYAETSESQFSKIMNNKVSLSLSQLSNIARRLGMREIDIYTYPVKMIDPQCYKRENSIKATLSLELSPDKKDQVLKLVFGENNLEIFNK